MGMEVLYNHYVMIKGQKAPWTTQYLNKTYETFGGFEPGSGSSGSPRVSGNYDTLGWGTLLYHLNESDVTLIRDSSTTGSAIHRSSTPATSLVKVQEATTSIPVNSDFLLVSATAVPASTGKSYSKEHHHGHHPQPPQPPRL